jgi:AraC-like DNA-binding protein
MRGPPPASVASTVLLPFARLLLGTPAPIRKALFAETERRLASSAISWQSILDRTTRRIAQRLSVELLEAAVSATGDHALGLHGAEASHPGDLELIEYLVRSCATVGESLEVWRRYLPIVLDADFEVTREAKQSVGRLQFAPDLLVSPALIDYSLALAVLLTLRNARHADPHAVQLQFMCAKPAYASEYKRILGHMPRFGQPYNGIVFTPDYERTAMLAPDPVLHQLLARQAQQEHAALQRHRSLTGRVREAIVQTLSSGSPLPLVAHALGTSAATLRRRLIAQGTNYRRLVEQTRRDSALRRLETPQVPIAEIAFELGYSHPPAFDRAFKRWYGRSPSEYRESLTHGAIALLDER